MLKQLSVEFFHTPKKWSLVTRRRACAICLSPVEPGTRKLPRGSRARTHHTCLQPKPKPSSPQFLVSICYRLVQSTHAKGAGCLGYGCDGSLGGEHDVHTACLFPASPGPWGQDRLQCPQGTSQLCAGTGAWSCGLHDPLRYRAVHACPRHGLTGMHVCARRCRHAARWSTSCVTYTPSECMRCGGFLTLNQQCIHAPGCRAGTTTPSLMSSWATMGACWPGRGPTTTRTGRPMPCGTRSRTAWTSGAG